MAEKIGIIAFSFALTQDEMERRFPNQCNKKLGMKTRHYYRKLENEGHLPVLIVQWEIALDYRFAAMNINPDMIVRKHRECGKYLDSDEIIAQAVPFLKQQEVTKVISVAQWLQNFKCRQILKKAGFEILPVKIGPIGFCKDSLQWWTRGPIRLVIYTIKQIFFGHHGR
ncbi:MAG: hypothetical protein ABH919_01160 [bacterium]